MNVTRTYNYLSAIILIVIYLALPATGFARAVIQESGGTSTEMAGGTATAAPCDSCPCSDGQGSDCCDTTFCNCACHAPLSHGLQLTYAPLVVIRNYPELSWSLPRVYRSIFVPPQNFV